MYVSLFLSYLACVVLGALCFVIGKAVFTLYPDRRLNYSELPTSIIIGGYAGGFLPFLLAEVLYKYAQFVGTPLGSAQALLYCTQTLAFVGVAACGVVFVIAILLMLSREQQNTL